MNLDLCNVAEEMKIKVLNDDGSHVFESPLLNKKKAEKLFEDYLKGFKVKYVSPVNPDYPDVSSYKVFVVGGQKNA